MSEFIKIKLKKISLQWLKFIGSIFKFIGTIHQFIGCGKDWNGKRVAHQ